MSVLKIGVIGAGHLGRIHAKLLGSVDGAQLVAMSDPSPQSLATFNQANPDVTVDQHTDYRDMIDDVDAVIVSSPTPTHAEIVTSLLDSGKHVFCEKPLTIAADDARRLAMIASSRGLTLQVGHVERFNPAFVALGDLGRDVKYVEAVRASSFPGRCLDVGVVMDLMIHDLDLILSMTDSPVKDVRASGIAAISGFEDIAETRIEFECGLVANVKASRISPAPTRSMQVFGPRGFASIDFSGPSISTIHASQSLQDRSFDLASATQSPLTYRDELFTEHLQCNEVKLEPRNAILDEQNDFVLSIQSGSSPVVNGHAGAAAVELAEQVVESIEARRWSATEDTVRGMYACLQPGTARRAA